MDVTGIDPSFYRVISDYLLNYGNTTVNAVLANFRYPSVQMFVGGIAWYSLNLDGPAGKQGENL